MVGRHRDEDTTTNSTPPYPSTVLCPQTAVFSDVSTNEQNTNNNNNNNNTSPPDAADTSKVSGRCPFLSSGSAAYASTTRTMQLEQLETGKTIEVNLSERTDAAKPRHSVGCTPHECHGAMMNKNGFDPVGNSYAQPAEAKIKEAVEFLTQFASETGRIEEKEDKLKHRIQEVVNDIRNYGSYEHTYEELEFGCRLAWRNTGRCIMRKVAFSLELRDCRSVKTALDAYHEIVEHLKYAANDGSINTVISVFPQKRDGISGPVRVWNSQLLGYAAYKRPDSTVMGDPANLVFTAFCVKLGWTPPSTKSDFDALPLIISDTIKGHSHPQVFELPPNAILEVDIHHPDHEMFSALNLRWYALPAISNMGVDIGGVFYQTCP